MSIMKFFQSISRFLAAYTSPVIVGVAAITFVYPELFRWVKGDVQTLVLGIIMLTMGMTLSTEDFKILAKRPFDIFIGVYDIDKNISYPDDFSETYNLTIYVSNSENVPFVLEW